MPNNHWVLVAERRSANPRKRQREIVYVTPDKGQAETDAGLMAKANKKMRYYVMPYETMQDVAETELRQLERALSDARTMARGAE